MVFCDWLFFHLVQYVGSLPVVQVVKNPPANPGDVGSSPRSGRPPEEGDGNSLQHSCLENPTDRGAWWATVPGVTESQTRLSDQNTCTNTGLEVSPRVAISYCVRALRIPREPQTKDAAGIQPSALTAACFGEPRGDPRWERTGYWSQLVKVHIKGMISLCLDSRIFPRSSLTCVLLLFSC